MYVEEINIRLPFIRNNIGYQDTFHFIRYVHKDERKTELGVLAEALDRVLEWPGEVVWIKEFEERGGELPVVGISRAEVFGEFIN
jgi:hypothetical protein